MKLYGVHSTCISNAKEILRRGFRASDEGRAGGGVYLWAYVSDYSTAAALADSWWQQCFEEGRYDGRKERGKAMLMCSIEIETPEYLNLNITFHHEQLRALFRRTKGAVSASKIFDDYIEGVRAARQMQHGARLKVVEALVPFPRPAKAGGRVLHLTVGADVYIVQKQAVSELSVTDTRPGNLRS